MSRFAGYDVYVWAPQDDEPWLWTPEKARKERVVWTLAEAEAVREEEAAKAGCSAEGYGTIYQDTRLCPIIHRAGEDPPEKYNWRRSWGSSSDSSSDSSSEKSLDQIYREVRYLKW